MASGLATTRREFIQLALTASTISVLPASVTPARAQTSSVTRLRVGLTPPSNQVTLGFRGQADDTGPVQPMYEFLTRSDRFTGQIGPGLAVSWETSPDAKTWHFKLRPNVPFHDGSLFTAKDVPFSWQLLTGQDSRMTSAPIWRGLVKTVDDINVVNDLEVVFNLSRPEPELLFYLCQANGFLIYSKDYWDKVGADGYAKQPIGTGPFKFQEFRAGEYILYNRVENHWRQTPEFKELQLLYMPEDSTRLASLLSGEIHVAEIPRSVQNQAIARGKQIVTSTRPAVHISADFGGNYLAAKNQPNAAPMTNKLVREAMNLAVNRKEINDQIFGGRGEAEIVQGYPHDDPAFDPAWKPYPFDPDNAKVLLAQAGYPNGFDFTMTVVTPPGFPEFPDVVEAMANYFTAIGLRPKLAPMEMATLINKQRSATLQNTLSSNRQSLRPVFAYALTEFASKGEEHFFEDPYIDERAARFAQSVDSAERLQILKEVGNFLYTNYATLPMLWLYAEVAIDPKVVAEYKADIGAFGASVDYEYAKAVV